MDPRPCIYVLYHPVTGEVRYVGQTVRPVRYRLSGHMSVAKKGHTTHVARWVDSLLREGIVPGAAVWEVCEIDQLDDREQFWIAGFREHGHRLTNHEDGGVRTKRGTRHSAEARARMSEARRGKKLSDEHRAAISRGRMGMRPSAETRAKQSAAHKGPGRPHTPESRRKISDSMRGVPKSPESVLRGSQSANSKLTEDDVREIKSLLAEGIRSQASIASQYGVSRTAISLIKQGVNWSHVTLDSFEGVIVR